MITLAAEGVAASGARGFGIGLLVCLAFALCKRKKDK